MAWINPSLTVNEGNNGSEFRLRTAFMSLNPVQFKEHLALRKQLGGIIGENRRLFPLPPDLKAQDKRNGSIFGPNHPDGAIPDDDLEARNARLRKKIDSTTISNATYGKFGA